MALGRRWGTVGPPAYSQLGTYKASGPPRQGEVAQAWSPKKKTRHFLSSSQPPRPFAWNFDFFLRSD